MRTTPGVLLKTGRLLNKPSPSNCSSESGISRPLKSRPRSSVWRDGYKQLKASQEVPEALLQARANAQRLQPIAGLQHDTNSLAQYKIARPVGRLIPFGTRHRKDKFIGSVIDDFGHVTSTQPSPTSLKKAKRAARTLPAFRQSSAFSTSAFRCKGTPDTNWTQVCPLVAPAVLSDGERPTHLEKNRLHSTVKPANDSDSIEELLSQSPKSTSHTERVLLRCRKNQPTIHTLQKIAKWHTQHVHLSSTISFNVLLGMAHSMRDRYLFKLLLEQMKAHNISYDRYTWHIIMEQWAGIGKWSQLVSVYQESQIAESPLDLIGWTRIVQAATRHGSTRLADSKRPSEPKARLNPIFKRAMMLPKGARHASPQDVLSKPNIDVDHLLASMLAEDMLPLDFQAVLVLVTRLAKQRRWQEADDLAIDYIERAKSFATDIDPGAIINAKTTDQCLGLLHACLQGWIINRSPPEASQAYSEAWLERHRELKLQPTYLTLHTLLLAYRHVSMLKCFRQASEFFQKFEARYDPPSNTILDKYTRAKCHRQMLMYAANYIRAARRQEDLQDVVEAAKSEIIHRYNYDLSKFLARHPLHVIKGRLRREAEDSASSYNLRPRDLVVERQMHRNILESIGIESLSAPIESAAVESRPVKRAKQEFERSKAGQKGVKNPQ